jgi:DNA-directed RNA polymerase subunit L
MELKAIKKTKNELELEITDVNETILNPITEILLRNDDVEYASYISDHPDSKKRKLYISVKSGKSAKPVDLLTKAVEQLKKEVNNFSKDFNSQAKSKK